YSGFEIIDMSRLRRSVNGYLRSMQMSSHALFVFVEGKSSDPYFYGKICHSAMSQSGKTYCICRAAELPGSTGGKQAVLGFFQYLRNRGSLLDDFKGKKTAMLFFVDKDIADFLHRRLRSEYLCYTAYYNVENYIFRHGDLAEGGALASSMEHRQLVFPLTTL